MTNSLKKNVLSMFGMQGINYLVPLIVLPYLTRVLGASGYGQMGLALALIQYFVLFTDFGFNLKSSKAIAQSKDNHAKISQIYWVTIACKFSLAIISLLILSALVFSIPKFYEIRVLVFITAMQIVASVLLPIWFFQGLEKMSLFALINSILKVLSVPLIFIFVKDYTDVYWAAGIQAGIPLFAGIYSTYFIFKNKLITRVKITFQEILSTVKESSVIFIGSLAIFLYTMSAPLILGLVNSYDEVGIYSAADKIKSALLGLFLVLGSVFYPRVNALIKEDSLKAFVFLKKLIIYQSLISVCIGLPFFILIPHAVNMILGQQFIQAGIILQIMSPMIFLIPMSVIFSNYILLSFGHNTLYARIPIFVGSLHLSYVIYFSKVFGAKGTAVAVLITEFISFIVLLIVTYKKGYIKKIIRA